MLCELSVIVPTYNRSELLRRCLASVLAEQSVKMEVLVADNASPDDTQAILASFADARLRYWRHETNVGIEKNILSLLKKARGEWVLCITDDDYLLPGGLRCLVAMAREDRSLGVILSAMKVVDVQGNFIRAYRFHDRTLKFAPGLDSLIGLVEASHVLSGIMMRREWIDIAGMEATEGSLYPQMYAVGSVLREHSGAYRDECILAHTTGNATDWDYAVDFMVGPRIRLINHLLPAPLWNAEREALLSRLRSEIVRHHVPVSLRKSVGAFLRHQRALLGYPEVALSGHYWLDLSLLIATVSWRKVRARKSCQGMS